MSEGRPTVSILVPTFQRPQFAARAAVAWLGQRGAPDFEVLLLDDGSEAPQLHELQAALPADARLRLIALPHQGLAATRNAGIEAARGTQLLFADDDVVPAQVDTLARWVRAAQGAAGAWMPRFSVSEAFAQSAVQLLWRERLERGGRRANGSLLGPTGFWFAAMLIERTALAVERFNPLFKGYGWEELELGARLHQRGVRARLASEVLVLHDDTIRFAELLRKYEEMGRNSWTFRAAAPGWNAALLTGTLAPVRWGRWLLRLEARGARVAAAMRAWADEPPGPGFKLDLKPLFLALEGAYTRGIRLGCAQPDRPGGT